MTTVARDMHRGCFWGGPVSIQERMARAALIATGLLTPRKGLDSQSFPRDQRTADLVDLKTARAHCSDMQSVSTVVFATPAIVECSGESV
jgi:hypothetical protein